MQVLVHQGSYRGFTVKNQVFDLVKDYKDGKRGGFVTVRSNGRFGPEHDVVRIRVTGRDDVQTGEFEEIQPVLGNSQDKETDEQVIERITQRFKILDDMTRATISGDIRAMIVTGPPGVGKSYGIEKQLEIAGLFNTLQSQREKKYEFVKGAMTALGLYCKLYQWSAEKNVVVFDDCDSVLLDDLSLNILKAALDSKKSRRIHWNSDSYKLREEGIPDNFEFSGSVIFVTNMKFEHVRSKKLSDHLEALQSRCHYLDLTLDTMRDKILRIQQIFNSGDLFEDYNLSEGQGEEIIAFMKENHAKLREVSLRMALKIADLTKVSTEWKSLAKSTCMK